MIPYILDDGIVKVNSSLRKRRKLIDEVNEGRMC